MQKRPKIFLSNLRLYNDPYDNCNAVDVNLFDRLYLDGISSNGSAWGHDPGTQEKSMGNELSLNRSRQLIRITVDAQKVAVKT